MSCDMTKAWKDAVSSESTESWLSDIAKGIPVQVKEVLANHDPPNIATLETLPWTGTTDAGVYGWLLKPKPKLYFNSECQLYVGSTGRYRYGLEGRKRQHLSKNPREHNRRLWYIKVSHNPLTKDINIPKGCTNSAEAEDYVEGRSVESMPNTV
jgi:hypothetical protein